MNRFQVDPKDVPTKAELPQFKKDFGEIDSELGEFAILNGFRYYPAQYLVDEYHRAATSYRCLASSFLFSE